VKDTTGKRWRKLCEQAQTEQDPDRFIGPNPGDRGLAGGEGSAMSKKNPCGVPFITPHGFVFPAVCAVASGQSNRTAGT